MFYCTYKFIIYYYRIVIFANIFKNEWFSYTMMFFIVYHTYGVALGALIVFCI
jgi:hypothetical protein